MYLVTYADSGYTYGTHTDVAIFSNKKDAIEFIKEEYDLDWDEEEDSASDEDHWCHIIKLPFYN